MCGIAGIADAGTIPNREALVVQMSMAMQHRGPDDHGSHHDHFASISMRRLAIIDLAKGHQPMYGADGRLAVVLNGEIYNYQRLRLDLMKQGRRFETNSDTEVLLHLYDLHGSNMLRFLKGMFAFCIYDTSRKRLFIARDRFGEKPLYYHCRNNVFSFASELSALLQNDRIRRRLNREALGYYLRTSLVPEPLTMFEDIFQLPCGHFLIFENNLLEIVNYYPIEFAEDDSITSESEASELITPLLKKAVERQMTSDVPIGCFLSGGIDSATIATLVAKQMSQPLATYHVKFADQAYDESDLAKQVAQHIGSNHTEITIPPIDFEEEIFWEIIDHVGQPFRDTSAIPTYFISKAIGSELKVALSGDGGDELFGGYNLFGWYERILSLQAIPANVRKTGAAIAQSFASYKWRQSEYFRKITRALTTSLQDTKEIAISLNEMYTKAQMDRLGYGQNNFTRLKDMPDSHDGWSPLRQIMYYRMRHTLPANMLVKVDRMSMANSLEVRCPFLDVDLFEAAATLPDRFLRKKDLGKIILRKIMKPYLPAQLFRQPKHGFNFPLFRFQNDSYKMLADELLGADSPLASILDYNQMNRIRSRGLDLASDGRLSTFRTTHQLWMLMQLSGWIKRFKVTV